MTSHRQLLLPKGYENIWAWRTPRTLLLTLAAGSLANAPISVYNQFFDGHGIWVALSILALLVTSALGTLYRHPSIRLLATIALILWVSASIYSAPGSPEIGLFMMIALASVILYLWPAPSLLRPHFAGEDGPKWEDILASCIASLIVGVRTWQTQADTYIIQAFALSITFAIPVLRAALLLPSLTQARKRLYSFVFISCALLASVPAMGHQYWTDLGVYFYVPIGLFSPALMTSLIGWAYFVKWLSPSAEFHLSARDLFLEDSEDVDLKVSSVNSSANLFDTVLNNPTRILVLSFAILCSLGTFLLHIPISTTDPSQLPWLDAAFTSVSGTCVTGLAVLDPGTDLTFLGQLILISLVQFGGIGIMVFSSAAILLLGGRLSLSTERVAVAMIGADNRSDIRETVKHVLLVTLITEATSALFLYLNFLWEGEDPVFSIWKAIFTSISAFCNAGLSLQANSMMSYNQNPFIIMTVASTIAIGGIGPPVVVAALAHKRHQRMTLHAQLVLVMTAILIVVPTMLVLALEWNWGLQGLSFPDKFFNALFQAISLRTAGFNSIDLTTMRPTTWTLMEVVMFIGGSPGSTAGGVKTTTIAVIFLAIWTVITSRDKIEILGRTIPHVVLLRATAIVTLSFVFFWLSLAAVLLTQQNLTPLEAIFEVVSATATVGGSLNATGKLDEIGQVVIMVCMFAGRVGPISLFVFFASGATGEGPKQFPTESVPVG